MKKRILVCILCLLMVFMNLTVVLGAQGSVIFDETKQQGEKDKEIKKEA